MLMKALFYSLLGKPHMPLLHLDSKRCTVRLTQMSWLVTAATTDTDVTEAE